MDLEVVATPEGVASNVAESQQESQPLQGCENLWPATLTQGFKANPGLKLANAFSVSNPGLKLANAFSVMSGYERYLVAVFEPRVAQAQPWAEISQRFQRYVSIVCHAGSPG
jgi:hypothetical protein